MSALWSGIPWCHFVHCWGLRSGNRLLHIPVCICKPWHLILLLKYASLIPREHVVSIWTEQFVRIALAWSCMDTYAVLKSFYSSEGKLPWNIDNLVSVSSMVVTTGLGSWVSSLSKSCWNLAGFWWRNFIMCVLLHLSFTAWLSPRINLWDISVCSRAVRRDCRTGIGAPQRSAVPAKLNPAGDTPGFSSSPLCSLFALCSQGLEELHWPSFRLGFSSTSPSSVSDAHWWNRLSWWVFTLFCSKTYY